MSYTFQETRICRYSYTNSLLNQVLFWLIFRYCYQEDLDVNRDVALATMYTAKKYILPSLEDGCKDILIEGLAPTNIWEVYMSSIMTPDEDLHTACREYFWRSVTEVESALESPDFLNIPHKVLLDMLQLNDTNGRCRIIVSQVELFKACNAWAEAECLRQKLEPSGENKREVLGACLFLVSFMTMLPEDIVRIVFPTEILNKDEKCALFEAAHSGYDRLTNPVYVPSELKFIVRWHHHTIRSSVSQGPKILRNILLSRDALWSTVP